MGRRLTAIGGPFSVRRLIIDAAVLVSACSTQMSDVRILPRCTTWRSERPRELIMPQTIALVGFFSLGDRHV